MRKLLHADCNGVVSYEDYSESKFNELKKLSEVGDSTYSAFCIVLIEDEIDREVGALLEQHRFEDAVNCIKNFAADIQFLDNNSMNNWRYIPDAKLDTTK